ncbi:AMP-binding protein [Pseudonocardia nigra]|uniref:AMP-binding protein n=1 Tax=Pseudonocardia nigra TaxID=1921578 RepID=UPI001C5D00DA|nr:AMP-binding protein [Pseudonocardia nigra]
MLAAAVTALEGWAAEVHLFGDLDEPAPRGAVVLPDSITPTAEATRSADRQLTDVRTRWRLYTSGTTGRPKPVDHDLGSLARLVRMRPQRSRRWGLLYAPTRMAGTQVVLQSLADGGLLIDAAHLSSVSEKFAWFAARRCTALSGTPSMWRQALQSPHSAELNLQQITLGGEIADQLVLDALAQAFPAARITHVFASTETGAAFSVSDGRAGFPATYLTDPPRGIRLAVRDSILHVHAPRVPGAGPDGFVSTGDVVELDRDRVHFRGRDSGVVNVAGVKVWPEQVETALRGHPDVVDSVVTARPNPLSGWILSAVVVPTREADEQTLPTRLRSYCAERLSSAHVPAVVKIVPSLTLAGSGKAVRR